MGDMRRNRGKHRHSLSHCFWRNQISMLLISQERKELDVISG